MFILRIIKVQIGLSEMLSEAEEYITSILIIVKYEQAQAEEATQKAQTQDLIVIFNLTFS